MFFCKPLHQLLYDHTAVKKYIAYHTFAQVPVPSRLTANDCTNLVGICSVQVVRSIAVAVQRDAVRRLVSVAVCSYRFEHVAAFPRLPARGRPDLLRRRRVQMITAITVLVQRYYVTCRIGHDDGLDAVRCVSVPASFPGNGSANVIDVRCIEVVDTIAVPIKWSVPAAIFGLNNGCTCCYEDQQYSHT